MTPVPLLEVRNVSKAFGGIRAVDGCSFAVEEGTITALIGPNGAGKTTMFNMINGLHRPNAGEIRFEGRRIDARGAAPDHPRRASAGPSRSAASSRRPDGARERRRAVARRAGCAG